MDLDCPEFCYEDYEPLCGTDGKTYHNECYLQMATCRPGSENLAVVYGGECEGI